MAITGNQEIAIEWSMVTLCAILVATRIYVRVYCRSKWTWSDGFVIIAWLSFLFQASMDTELFRTGFWSSYNTEAQLPNTTPFEETEIEAHRIYWLKIIYVEDILYYNCMYAVKASMLLFYFELISPSLTVIYGALWGTICLTISGFIIEICLLAFGCLPVNRNWSLDPEISCQSVALDRIIFPSLSLHLLTDVLIYCLPIPIVSKLNLPLRQKIGVGLIFAIGFLDVALAALVIGLRFQNTGIYSIMEQTWAIIVACCPALKAFLTRDVRRTLKKIWPGENRRRSRDTDGSCGCCGSFGSSICKSKKNATKRSSTTRTTGGTTSKRDDEDVLELVPTIVANSGVSLQSSTTVD